MNKCKQILSWMLVLCMVCSFLPAGAFAAESSAPTTNLTTTGSPFQKGTGESNSFRIPALVTLHDGTLVAAADARWNTTYDGGGLDTMVAISRDNGATWTHSFANYLGDNGNVYNGSSSTCFIDPALAVRTTDAGETIYMLCDLYPYGIALNGSSNTAPSTDVGFTAEGYLKLDYNSQGTYAYYLKDGKIYSAANNAVISNYSVDEHFNITSTAYNVDTNLFFADSPFKVARTGYLYLTTSTDGGENWSAPQLLNLKTSGELVCLVGPGRGLVTGSGTIVFPVYSYNGSESSQRLSFLYSTDGVNWTRSDSLPYSWASESVAIELDENNLRFFFRNGSKTLMYADYNWASGWSTPQSTGLAVNSNCQISAIRLQQTIDAEPVILVSCPGGSDASGSNQSGASYRTNGKIFLFTLGQNNTLTHRKTLSVPSVNSANNFMYSCMTALTDENGSETGRIAILYEDNESAWGAGTNHYYQMSYKTFDVAKDFGVTLDNPDDDPDIPGGEDADAIPVTVKVGQTVTQTIDGVSLSGSHADTTFATVTWTGATTGGDTTVTLAPVTPPTSAGSIQCLISDGNGNYLTLKNGSLTNVTEAADATTWTVTYVDTPNWAGGASRYTIKSGAYYVTLSGSNLVASTTAASHQHYCTAAAGFYCSSSGSNAWIYSNGWTIGTAGSNSAKTYTAKTVTTDPTTSTTVTITGNRIGRTQVSVGDTTYTITVTADVSNVLDVELSVGERFSRTDATGNYENSITLAPDAAIASLQVKGTTVPGSTSVTDVAAVVSGNSYYIRTNNNTYLTADAEETDDVTQAAKWVFSDNYSYTLSCGSKYLTYEDGTFSTVDSEWYAGYFYMDGGTIRIYDWNSRAYVNVASAVDISATLPSASTDITFTGVKAGTTTAIIGDTQYNITVLSNNNIVDIELEVGESFTYTDTTGNHTGSISQRPNEAYATMTVAVAANTSEATRVTFTGIAEGTAAATVGTTQYNITVVPQEVDDEVMNSATRTWTVDPEYQRQRYNALIGLDPDQYTADSWSAYEAARQTAYRKDIEVTNSSYDTQAQAQAALAELTALMDALETAHSNLTGVTTITVRFTLDTADGTLVDTRTYPVLATEPTLSLPATILVDDMVYQVTIPTLTLGSDTTFTVPVTKIGAQGNGFVASADVSAGYHNNVEQVTDLVNENGAKQITKMTLTAGIEYDLNLATDTTGKTVEWRIDDDSVATVDENGKVTATGAGTTKLTATVLDDNGEVVEVNTMPITVFPKGTADRKTAIYIDSIQGATVWCVFNADYENRSFQVHSGELIYGQFDTKVANNTHTTSVSFFSNPDDGAALVYMKSTNSNDQYFLLHDDAGNLYDGTAANASNTAYFVSGATSGAGYWQAVGLNNNQSPNWQPIKDMVQWSIDLGCDGGLGFTRRQNEGGLSSCLSFAADPLPSISKTVDGVLPTSRKQADYRHYVENMVAAVNEQAYFRITVTQEVPTVWADQDATVSAISYSNAYVTDNVLPSGYLYTKELDQNDGIWDGEIAEDFRTQQDNITAELNSPWTAEQKAAGKRVFEYYLVYEIQEADIPKFWIDNIANLSFNYKSTYSTGAQAGAADAEAHISVVGSAIDEVVIDFGQTITYTGLTNSELKGVYVDGDNDVDGVTQCKTSAKYGDVTVTREQKTDSSGKPLLDHNGYPQYEYTVTYTPHSILREPDAIILYGQGDNGQEKIINGFLVYPATTVYYEEGFMLNENSTWDASQAAKATTQQTFERLGKFHYDLKFMGTDHLKTHAYGYDPLYAQPGYTYGDSYASANTVGQTTSFQFTGTGFDLYANCTAETGYVSVVVQNSAGKYLKMYMVDTVVKSGETAATQGQTGVSFHLPIVSADLGIHDTYTVTVTKIMETEPVRLDGIRIHNTIADSGVYEFDLEDNPEFYQLRDYVLSAVDLDQIASQLYGPDWLNNENILIGDLAEQVFGAIRGDSEKPFSAIVTSNDQNLYTDGKTAQDLLYNGPKNELFLYPGQTLTFGVNTNRSMQIGLKAPRAPTSYTLRYTANHTATTVAENQTLKTSVDMFYALNNPIGAETTYTVTVTNTGSDILSVTDLKICDDPSAALVPLTVADVEQLLTDAGFGTPEQTTPESETFTISLAQVELGNALNLNFLFLADSYADWTGCYAVLTKTYADGRDNVTVTVPADQWEDKPSGGKQYKRIGFHNISAKEMADSITIQVFNADGVAISNEHTDSIVGYLERMLGKNSNAEFRALAVDMLNYGAAAQTQFNYNLDNLANANIGDYQQYGTATDAVCANNQVKGDNVRGASVSLENNIIMNVYFVDQTADMTAEVTFKNHAGTDMTVVLTSVDTPNGYCFQIDKLAVADMRTMVTITCKDADGNVYGTLTDSVEGYVARTGLTKAINQAIMKFSDSAYAYLH